MGISNGRNKQKNNGGLIKASRSEIREYARILRMLDQQQQLNISAHLYSAFLLSKMTHYNRQGHLVNEQLPRRWWAQWPNKAAPIPPTIDSVMPDDNPQIVSEDSINRVRENLSLRTNIWSRDEASKKTSARRALFGACEEVLQRQINQKIHKEKRANLEPILEPEPKLNEGSMHELLEVLDKYLLKSKGAESVSRTELLSWNELDIQGPAKVRLNKLFETGFTQYLNHDRDGPRLDDTDEDGEDGEDGEENDDYGDG